MDFYNVGIIIVAILGIIVFLGNDIRKANNTFRVSDIAIEEKRKELGNIKMIVFEGSRQIYPIDANGHYVVINKERGKAEKVVVYLQNSADMKYMKPEETIIKEVDVCKPSIYTYMLIPKEGTGKHYNIFIIVVPKNGVLSHIN